MAPSWVVNPERGDSIRHKSVFDLSGLDSRFVHMHFDAMNRDYTVVFRVNVVPFQVYWVFFRAASLFCQGQSLFGGVDWAKETSVTVPPEVSTDVAALESVLFWVISGRLLDIHRLTATDVLEKLTFPSIGYMGDLLEIYKIAKFLEMENLATALLDDAVDIFTDKSVHTDVQNQLGRLLRASQHVDGFVNWYPLYETVCLCLANKYQGVTILTTHPFAYTRHTWETMWHLCAKQMSSWGDLIDLFFVLFETPEVITKIVY
jgi:hypothetical protein